MTPLPRRAPFPITPLLIGGLALGLAGMPWIFSADDPVQRGTAPARQEAVTVLPPLSDLSETLQRPLFESLRQPRSAPQAAQSEGPMVIGKYRLVGIIAAGSRRQAMLTRSDTGRSALYGAGDVLDDWAVAEVLEDGLTVRRSGESETVRLRSSAPPRR